VHQRTSEKRQDTARSVTAEHSGEIGATLASDSRRTAASHLGRAYAGAYRGDGECAGALGVELEALLRPAASGGACSGNGARRNCCCYWCTGGGRRERRGRQNGGRVLGARVGVPTRGGGGGRPRRAQRRRTAATWPSLNGARWAPRAGERGEREAGRAAGWAEREAGLAQQRLSPFLFFLNLFSQFLSKFIWTIYKSFAPFSPKSKVVPKQKPYHFVSISKTKFQIEFELQIKTSSRFSNKFILGIFV